jgi:transposase
MESCAKELVRHVSQEELKRLVRKEKDRYVHERLLFINQLYLGASVETACERMCIAVQTGYNWLDLWNGGGYEGLGPDFGGGKPPKLIGEQKRTLAARLWSKPGWLTGEIRALIRKDFGVTYSLRHVARILRGLGMSHSKPYVNDYRKPCNAEDLLRESIKEAAKDLPNDTVVGFLDEASPQTTDNRQRVWSFGKPKAARNTSKYRANTFGFYPINGKEVVEFGRDSKIPSMRDFLRRVKDKNPGKRILVFADNFATHRAQATIRFAGSIGISIVFLPKYSPDLNPIEFIWKSIRQRISGIRFIRSEWSLKESVRTAFHRLAKRKSFMAGWLDKFGPCISNLLCQ